MQAWFNMPTHQFVDQLRDIAIKAGARPAVIDCLDAIVDAPSEDEIKERVAEAEEESEKFGFQNGKEDMWQDCYNLVVDCNGDEATLDKVLELLNGIKP